MQTPPGRRPGRPRSRRADDAILSAALDLLGERGNIAEVSIEAIAARAGVGKATIYRRWPGKEELLVDAVATLRPPLPDLDEGSMRGDLVLLLEQVCAEMDGKLQRAINALLVSRAHPEIGARIKHAVLAPRREALYQVLRRGAETGELRPGADPEAVLNLLMGGALLHRRSAGGGSPRACAELLVDTLLAGIAAPRPA
ncbi:TetR/AcrR family transcriptional regulator [Marinactinospora thermotolerans]|uniref:Transcriptional regulator, TetR family n=1 Tax=Marinactinospora thermotolerans DSM 45154 TaxID=1122192 RepID=A0A1T4MAV3_9ACTN|nr:TetR/AcrR family transcriptional regulator [Marinactinospora thermotolerans]SJZ64149.1 transcriptional regulator, TetR family [Marinactinospora thermotolerans DSM 45154]